MTVVVQERVKVAVFWLRWTSRGTGPHNVVSRATVHIWCQSQTVKSGPEFAEIG